MSRIPLQQGVLTRKEKRDGDLNLENYSQIMADDEENQLSLSEDSQGSPLLEEKERDNQDNPEQSSHRPRKRITCQLRNGAIFAFLFLSCITNIILLTRKPPYERSKYGPLSFLDYYFFLLTSTKPISPRMSQSHLNGLQNIATQTSPKLPRFGKVSVSTSAWSPCHTPGPRKSPFRAPSHSPGTIHKASTF